MKNYRGPYCITYNTEPAGQQAEWDAGQHFFFTVKQVQQYMQ